MFLVLSSASSLFYLKVPELGSAKTEKFTANSDDNHNMYNNFQHFELCQGSIFYVPSLQINQFKDVLYLFTRALLGSY